MRTRALASMLAVSTLCSCGDRTLPEPVVGTIDGLVYVTGPVAGAVVTAYPLDLNTGEAGDVLGVSGSTEEDGAFHLELGPHFGPLLLVARGPQATYTEPASGVDVSWNSTTELAAAYVRWTPEQTVAFELERGDQVSPFVISPWTSLAYEYANGRTAIFETSLRAATLLLLDHLEIEFWSVPPVSLTDSAVGGWNDGIVAGLELAGLSQLVLRMARDSQLSDAGLTSLQLLDLLEHDVQDEAGELDGRGGTTALRLGSCSTVCELGPATLRAHWAEAIASFLGSESNGSGIGVTDADGLLHDIACRDQAGSWWTALDGDCAYDSAPPSITIDGIEDGEAYRDTVTATISLFDAVELGLYEISFHRGARTIDPAFASITADTHSKQETTLTLRLNTAALTDGPVVLEVTVADAVGHTAMAELTLVLDNSPLGHIAGAVALGGRIVGGRVTAYEFDEGVRGANLGATTTDSTGSYVIEVAPTTATSILLEIDNPADGTAFYAEAATGETVELSTTDRLRSALTGWYDGAERVDGIVTSWTEIGTAFAHGRHAAGLGTSWTDAVEESFTLLEEHFADGGPAIDLRGVLPSTLLGAATLNSQVRYGLLLAALSELAAQHAAASSATTATMNTLSLTRKLALDLGDDYLGGESTPPLFDGTFGAGILRHGEVQLDSHTTRLELAVALSSYLTGSHNTTPFSEFDVGTLLDRMSMDSRPELYPDEGGPYDVIAPTPVAFTVPTPAEGQVLRGTISLRAEASDNHALDTVVWESPPGISGTTTDTSAGPAGPWVLLGTLNTDGFAEGAMPVTVRATDEAGRSTSVARTLVIDRTSPVVLVTGATTADGPLFPGAITGRPSVTLAGTATDLHLASLVYSVNGGPSISVPVDAGGDWATSVALGGGPNIVRVTATDAAGNSSYVETGYTRDAAPPNTTVITSSFRDDAGTTVTLSPASGAATSVSYSGSGLATLANGASFTRFASDYAPISAQLPEWRFQLSDDHTTTADILLEARLMRGSGVLVDWQPVPSVPPGGGYDRARVLSSGYHPDLATVSGTYKLQYRATDSYGNTTPTATVTWTQTLRPPPIRQRASSGSCSASEPACPLFYNLDNTLNNTDVAVKGGAALPGGKLRVGQGFIDNPNDVPVRIKFAAAASATFRVGTVWNHPQVADPSGVVLGCFHGVNDQLMDGTCYSAPSTTEATTSTTSAGSIYSDIEVMDGSGTLIAACTGCAANVREIPPHSSVTVYVRANPFGFLWSGALAAIASIGSLTNLTGSLDVEWLECTGVPDDPSHPNCTNQIKRRAVKRLTRILVTSDVKMSLSARPASSGTAFDTPVGDGVSTNFAYGNFVWSTHEIGWPSF